MRTYWLQNALIKSPTRLYYFLLLFIASLSPCAAHAQSVSVNINLTDKPLSVLNFRQISNSFMNNNK